MGCAERKQPLLGEVSVWPSLMVRTTSPASLVLPLAQDATQAHPNPAVQFGKGAAMTVFEIAKPSPQRPVGVLNQVVEAVPLGAPGLGSCL
jgi:hypothetical protein